MKEIKIYCDDCKKELLWSEQYFIVSIVVHMPNLSYSGMDAKEKHYCKDCFSKKY